jgi:hypothetical protein
MEEVIVTKQVLEIHDRYQGDFGLLDERWASEEDRQKVTAEQCHLLGEYVDKLHFIKLDPGLYCVEMREDARKRIAALEKVIDAEVVAILRKRVLEEIS